MGDFNGDFLLKKGIIPGVIQKWNKPKLTKLLLERSFAHVLMQAVIRYWSVLCTRARLVLLSALPSCTLAVGGHPKGGQNSDGFFSPSMPRGARKKETWRILATGRRPHLDSVRLCSGAWALAGVSGS